jgi:two-component system nitrate/nitrite response regulator NarL
MSAQRRARVFVADDHPVYREGLVRAIRGRAELEFIGQAGGGAEALDEIKRLRPDVALLDVQMPGLDGLAVLRAIERDRVPTEVVLLTGYAGSETVYRGLAHGARGCLSKTASHGAICDAIIAATRGETVVSQELQGPLAEQIRFRELDDRPVLTERERQMLSETARGHSASEIGRRLHLSAATVRTHLQNAYQKLGVSDRAAAVSAAIRRGLID